MENGCRILAYADDTLIVATGESVEGAKRRATRQIARTIKNIKDLHLKVSASKTEVVVFTPKRKATPRIEIIVDRQFICSEKTMKYLGVIMDGKLSFVEHMEYVSEKVTKVTRALWRLMPNLHGPTEKRRRLYANVLSSIILYAAPVWAHKANIRGSVSRSLTEMHRKVVLRVIAAYRTVALDAAALLARIPPYHMTAEARKRAYDKIRDMKINEQWSRKEEKMVIANEVQLSFDKWREYLLTQNVAGVRTREAIMPIWNEWMGRGFGNISFHLTQALTGHGVFYSYLKRIGKAQSDKYPHCNTDNVDTVEHTLFVCQTWQEERDELLVKINLVADALNLKSMVKSMVSSRKEWSSVQSYVEKIMYGKEELERRLERMAIEDTDDAIST